MFPLTLELIDFLLTEPAQVVLKRLSEQDLRATATLGVLSRLRRAFEPEEAAALLDQARLRQRAAGKFPQAATLLFDDEALQQASSRVVALYRAQGYRDYHRVADLGCGIGADTIALAEAGLEVLAVEKDPIRAKLAQANVATLGLDRRVVIHCADWTKLRLNVDAAFVDPSRRRGERRVFSPDAMDPPLSAIQQLRTQVPAVAVKMAPGITDEAIPPEAEVEFISERGVMKEALLRFASLRNGPARRATLLPGPLHLDGDAPVGSVPVRPPSAVILEPDGAVIRAGLVRHLATSLDAAQLDARIAYLTVPGPLDTPFARAWQVVRHGAFHLKTLNHWLRDLGAGQLVIKKRGSAIDPEAFRRRLKTAPGGRPLTIFLTRVMDRPWMIVGEDL